MPDIFHDFTIAAKRGAVFEAIATPAGLTEWWTKTAFGEPRAGAARGRPGFDWRARVTAVVPNETFEL